MNNHLTVEQIETGQAEKTPHVNGSKKSSTGGSYVQESHPKVVQFISDTLKQEVVKSLLWFDAADYNSLQLNGQPRNGIANLQRINDIPDINSFLQWSNDHLKVGDYSVICLETMSQRKRRIMKKFPGLLRNIYYYFDFIFKRVFPKWGPTRWVYMKITGGRNRVISLVEGLGRLVYSGFSIVDYKSIGSLTYVITQKTGNPDNESAPTFGAICRLKRIGQGGEPFTVYKLRTMYPYSEFLQDFVFKNNDLEEGGKMRNDFRVTSWGKWMRRMWIDELPMFYNWLKGDMKFVGVRPLSQQFFNLYPEDLQNLRNKVKPGLIPPFYADMPDTLDEIIESERAYIYSYLGKPLRTDIRYFFKAIYNILVKGARSK